MNLNEEISADFISAYKAKDLNKKNFLGVLKGGIKNRYGASPSDDNVLKEIKAMVKGLNDTIACKVKVSSPVDSEELELSYLDKYLPSLMGESEIRLNIKSIMVESGEINAGKLIGLFNKTYSGKADNKMVSRIIQEELI